MPGPVDDSVTIHVQARQEAIPGLVDMPSPSMWTWPATSVRYLPPTTPSFPRSRNQFKTNPTMNRACTGVDQPAISDAVPAPTPANVRTPPATPDPQQPMMLVLDAATVASRPEPAAAGSMCRCRPGRGSGCPSCRSFRPPSRWDVDGLQLLGDRNRRKIDPGVHRPEHEIRLVALHQGPELAGAGGWIGLGV